MRPKTHFEALASHVKPSVIIVGFDLTPMKRPIGDVASVNERSNASTHKDLHAGDILLVPKEATLRTRTFVPGG